MRRRMSIQTLLLCALALAVAAPLHAQAPRPPGTGPSIDGTVGNSVLQLHYLSRAPTSQVSGDLDYGFLLSESRDIIGSAALLFDTNVSGAVRHLQLSVGPQAYVALLNAEQKTDVFALAVGASARYEIIPRLGLSAVVTAFYSPGVTTFGSAHNLYDFTAGGEIRFSDKFYGLAGYRWLKFTLVNEPDDKVGNEIYGGLRWLL
jgi:hypothetical protein